jgi:hypothetical protein
MARGFLQLASCQWVCEIIGYEDKFWYDTKATWMDNGGELYPTDGDIHALKVGVLLHESGQLS